MRLWRRGRINDEEDEEIVSRVRRLMRRPRLGTEGAKPSGEAVRIYVDRGLEILRKHLEALGANNEELRKALDLGRKALIESYPDPVDLEELARGLLASVRTPQRKPRSWLPWA